MEDKKSESNENYVLLLEDQYYVVFMFGVLVTTKRLDEATTYNSLEQAKEEKKYLFKSQSIRFSIQTIIK